MFVQCCVAQWGRSPEVYTLSGRFEPGLLRVKMNLYNIHIILKTLMTKVDLLGILTYLNDCAQEKDVNPCSGTVMEILLIICCFSGMNVHSVTAK